MSSLNHTLRKIPLRGRVVRRRSALVAQGARRYASRPWAPSRAAAAAQGFASAARKKQNSAHAVDRTMASPLSPPVVASPLGKGRALTRPEAEAILRPTSPFRVPADRPPPLPSPLTSSPPRCASAPAPRIRHPPPSPISSLPLPVVGLPLRLGRPEHRPHFVRYRRVVLGLVVVGRGESPFDCWQNPQSTPLTHLIGLPVHPTNIPLAPMNVSSRI